MQTDGGFVQHVQHVDQAGAEGRGQRHAPGLAAAERAQRPIERQVVQPYVLQIAQSSRDLLEHHAAHPAPPVIEPQIVEKRQRIANLHGRDLGDVPLADAHGQRLGRSRCP